MPVTTSVLPPTFTTKDARGFGVHPRDLYAWRDSGQIVEISRGVFRRGDAPPASYPDVLAVAYRAPRAILCCLSAAAIHDLTDELLGSVHIAVPMGTYKPTIDRPLTTVYRFRADTFELGLTGLEAAPGESVRVYDAARTVVDLMRLRHRFGEPAAHSALHRFLAAPGARPALLLDYAQALGVLGPMRAALDIASAR
ncbi:MAG: type IV toxin-antitoxin system AbiEi family antitoxin domain-containing protein [Demequinaceae bacterium]|nr:type IV toxin-antitoxin system AbiEi family antitoxin domain-containing protein [Demequinaceae bacterium]